MAKKFRPRYKVFWQIPNSKINFQLLRFNFILLKKILLIKIPIVPVNKKRMPRTNNGGELLTSILAEVKALDQNKMKVNPINRDFRFIMVNEMVTKTTF